METIQSLPIPSILNESIQLVNRKRRAVRVQVQEVYEDYVDPTIQREKLQQLVHRLQRNRKIFFLIVVLAMCLSSLIHDARMVSVPSRDLSTDNNRPLGSSGRTEIVRLAALHQPTEVEKQINISAAICFKTLFGSIDLGIVIQWAAYNRFLGFDHIFMWYRPEMRNVSRFDELEALPFVTLTENTNGTRKDYYSQWYTEKKCLSQKAYAGSYDWALLADIDEYLWFPEKIGVKDFLKRFHHNMTYLSFGKQMYTLDHRLIDESRVGNDRLTNYHVDTMAPGWAVSQYPFYLPHFCYHQQRRGDPHCPTWRGRAKVMVKPQHHQRVDVHGTIFHPDPSKGTIHFDTDTVAHFKEWPEIFAGHNVTLRPSSDDFMIQHEFDVHIHNLWRAFKPTKTADNGTNLYEMQHDPSLQEWFQYVKSRANPQ